MPRDWPFRKNLFSITALPPAFGAAGAWRIAGTLSPEQDTTPAPGTPVRGALPLLTSEAAKKSEPAGDRTGTTGRKKWHSAF